MSRGVVVVNDLSGLRPVDADAVADVTVGSTVVVGLEGVPAAARVVQVQADPQGGDMRYTLDGSTPAGASHGFVLYSGQFLTLSRRSAARIRLVRDGASNGKLAVQGLTMGGLG